MSAMPSQERIDVALRVIAGMTGESDRSAGRYYQQVAGRPWDGDPDDPPTPDDVRRAAVQTLAEAFQTLRSSLAAAGAQVQQ